MKRLTALMLCLTLLLGCTCALADRIDESIFRYEDNYEKKDTGKWSYYERIVLTYADAYVICYLCQDGGGSNTSVPYLQIYIVDPNTRKVNFKATGLDIAIGKTTYSYRKLEALSDGSATVDLGDDGRQVVEALAGASKISITFYTIGKQFRQTISGSEYADNFKHAAKLIMKADAWGKLTSAEKSYFDEQERKYPLKVYTAK